MAENLNIKISGNSKSAQDALKKASVAMKTIGATAKKVGANLKKNFKANWVGITATVGLAVVQMKKSIQAFNKQEASDVKLAKSLALVGDTSEETLESFKTMADEIQNLTTVGDEDTQMLQSLALSMGVTKDKVDEATRGSIGLAAAFAKAGLSQETAMKGVALAYQGNFSQLERYIPALRETKDETLKMTILQNEMAKGFSLAKSEVNTAEGAMKQMSNALGDAQESIGGALIPVLLPLVKNIKFAAEAFEKLPTPAKNTAVAIAGAGVAMSIAIKLFGLSLSSAGALGIALLALAGTYKLVKMAADAGSKAVRGWNEVTTAGELEKAKKDLTGYNEELKKIGWSTAMTKDELAKYIESVAKSNEGFREAGRQLQAGKISQQEYAEAWTRSKEEALANNEALIEVTDKIVNTTEAIRDFEATSAANSELEKARRNENVTGKTEEVDALLMENQRLIDEKLAADKVKNKKKNKATGKQDKKEISDEQKKQNALKKAAADTAAFKAAILERGANDIIDAAASEKATLGSVAAAGIRAIGESLANQMKIRAIAAVATGNFAAAAGYGAASAGITLLTNRVAAGIEGGKKFEEGGIIDEHVVGVGLQSGQRYDIGENGSERVSRTDEVEGDEGGSGGGTTIQIMGDLIVQPATLPDTADEIQDQLGTRTNKRGS